ncbi:MAG: glycosyltransferase [Pyrinomonadaceae bacterium]
MLWDLLLTVQWLCLAFFVGINVSYIVLCLISFLALPKIVERHFLLRELPQPHTSYEIPISLMVTAYNEEAVIVESVRSLLQIDYPEYEIVVVNDGSKDKTLEVMIDAFDMVELPVTVRSRLPHKPITAVYRSKLFPQLRMIDKENGGCKADASNAGIDASIFPLVSPLDADTVLERDTHKLLVQPFLEDSSTVAVGGAVRIANGCLVKEGVLVEKGLATFKPLVLFQVLEYLRAFLFVRVGWAALDALPIISGAIGLFDREAVVEVGGYSRETHAEDLEIILRMHLYYIESGKKYNIANVPDANCWTEAPETYKILRKQRVRWHQGFVECLWFNRKLVFNRKGGLLSWVSIPFQFVFEAFSPLIEISGYVSTIILFAFGHLSLYGAGIFFVLSVSLGILLTFTSILLEEIIFHTYPKTTHLLTLFAASVLENFGYRQINAIWRFTGLLYWAIGYEESRVMIRSASWQGQGGGETSSQEGSKDSIISEGHGSKA